MPTTCASAYLATVIVILIAAALIGADDDAGRGDNFGDYFNAFDAWRLIAFLTIGYMIARGLAKSGSREPYWEGGSNEERAGTPANANGRWDSSLRSTSADVRTNRAGHP